MNRASWTQTSGRAELYRRRARVSSFFVAALAWTGLALQLVSDAQTASFLHAALHELSYFTIWTNALVAIAFSGLALGSRRASAPMLIGGLTLAIAMVGVIYHLLLAKLYHLTGVAALSNAFMHTVVPIAVCLFWVFCAPRGALRLRDPLLWAAYPLAYLLFTLTRGEMTGFYPYPFIDVAKIGLTETLINAVLIAVGFLACGWILVLIDRVAATRTLTK